MPEQYTPQEVYQGLRTMALGVTAEQIGIDAGPHEPYAVVMETGYDHAVVTLVAIADGSASIYFSTGGGLHGGVAHDAKRGAAVDLVDIAGDFAGEMDTVTEFPQPDAGDVVFYVLTPAASYSVSDSEQSMGLGQSPFTPLFFAGQRLITEYRRVNEVNRNPSG